MGLFTKKPIQTSSSAPLYTVGNQKTILLVGLGNPGKEFAGTRHNVGFMCLDSFVETHEAFSDWIEKKDLKCLITSAQLGAQRVIAIKPTTFMNLSGEAVQAVQHFYKIPNANMVVVYDELDLSFGQIRVREGGSSAGHNGIKSLSQHCGHDFKRVRIGINNENRGKHDEKDFVLKKFSKEEQGQLKDLTREVTSILTEYIYSEQLPAETRSFII